MNQSPPAALDLEAATDQLVDEICQRLSVLYRLVETSMSEAGPPVEDIRAHASELARRLSGPQPTITASSIVRALWPPQAGTQIPRSWRATPLGALIVSARTGVSSAAALSSPAMSQPRNG